MTDRLVVDGVYKIFSDRPEPALRLLAAGADKDAVLAEIGQTVGLNNVSLTVPAGAVYMVMGLSGSGKSTLARCINRLIEPSAGRILLDGEDIATATPDRLRELRRTRISMVFQHFALLPNKNVVENVEFGLKLRGVPSVERRRKAEEVLSVVGLSQWTYHRPGQLSGGMRQRVGLARALATDADLLIMDEAFSALDPLIRSEMQDELLRLQRVLQKTILFITHDFQEALKLGTRIAIMANGAVVREGTPQEIVLDPRSDYVAAFTRDIDRARLFDAASVMVPAHPIVLDDAGRIAQASATASERAFLVDAAGRLIGSLDAMTAGQAGVDLRALASSEHLTVPPDAKLIDVARAWRPGGAVAVADADGRLLGRIMPEHILARIGQTGVTTGVTTGAAKEAGCSAST